MNEATAKRLKYEREALAEGVAIKHDSMGVILKTLAKLIDAQPITSKGRERCGELGKPRTERARARAAFRKRGVKERTATFRPWAMWMGMSV